jgi:uncharacterized protein
MLIKPEVKGKNKNEKKPEKFFPENLFGRIKDINEKQELKEKKKYRPEPIIYEITELGKQFIKASENGNLEIVKELIDKGVDLNVRNKKGKTPLILAAWNGYIEISKLLIENNADLNVQDENGVTALILAAREGYTEISKSLIDNGANLNIQYEQGKTALYIAKIKDRSVIVEMLRKAGAKE